MYQLQKIYKNNPDIESISLQYQNITDLTLAITILKKLKKLKSLSLHGNRLQKIPLANELESIQELDLSRNPLKIDHFLLDSLFSFPNLNSLVIDGTEDEMQKIIENLPKLLRLNGRKILRKEINHQQIEETRRKIEMLRLEKQNLQTMASQIIKSFEFVDVDISEVDMIFQESVADLKKIEETIPHQNCKQAIFYHFSSKILDTIAERICDLFAFNNQVQFSDAFLKIYHKKKEYFNNLFSIFMRVGYNQLFEKEKQENNFMDNQKLRKEKLYLKQIDRLKKLKDQLKLQNKRLEEENTKLLQKMYRYRDKGENFDEGEREIMNNLIKTETRMSESTNKMANRTKLDRENKPKELLIGSQSESQFKNNRSLSKLGNDPKQIPLTLEQTNNLVADIVKQKQIYNSRSVAKNDSFITAEDFLSVYFTRKYGLKSLAINSTVNFLKSLEHYAKNNSLLSLFLKILKNQVEESFYEEHQQFLDKVDTQLSKLFKKFTKNGVSLTSDSVFFQYFPNENIEDYSFPLEEITSSRELQTFKLNLANIHIELHENQLRQFLNLFQKYDVQQEGAISKQVSQKLVLDFFRGKIQEGVVSETVLLTIKRQFMKIQRSKLVFSELVELVDKI